MRVQGSTEDWTLIARAHKEGKVPRVISLWRWQPCGLVVALSLEMGFSSRLAKGV